MKNLSLLMCILLLFTVTIFTVSDTLAQATGVTTTNAKGTIKRDATNLVPVIAYWDSSGNTIYMVNSNYPLPVAPPQYYSVSYSDSVIVEDTSKTILSGNGKILSAVFTNISDSAVFLRFGTGARVNSGIYLAAGQTFKFGAATDVPYTGTVTAITAATLDKKLTRTVVLKR